MVQIRHFTLLTLSLLLLISYSIFKQGLGGDFLFDDYSNLSGLTQVNSTSTALDYIYSGIAGPGGRPLSLLTFAIQATSWPDHPSNFIHVNIFIHLINGLLVGALSMKLANFTSSPNKSIFTLLVTSFWILHPIQVSPVLFVVQRMTLLSATFTLLGVVLYLHGRKYHANNIWSWVWILLALCMTIPATLSKENGILLPGLLLIIEVTLLSGLSSNYEIKPSSVGSNHVVIFRNLLIAIMVLAIAFPSLLYLYRLWPDFEDIVFSKGYTLSLHAATESRVVLDYLALILLPRTAEFSPFNDDYVVSTSILEPRVILAAACLVLLVVIAWVARHRIPLLSCGIGVFLWGHILESSFIPLELYFEHRNYIPVLGVALALMGLAQESLKYRVLATASFSGFILISMFITYQYATLWGNRELSAYIWHSDRPYSARSTQYLARYLARQGQWVDFSRVVTESWRKNPKNMNLAFLVMYGTCHQSDTNIGDKTIADLLYTARNGYYSLQSTKTLDYVVEQIIHRQCKAISLLNILQIVDELDINPRYHVFPEVEADLYTVRSKVLYSQGKRYQAARFLDMAANRFFSLDLALQAAKIYAESGCMADSQRLLQLSRAHVPPNVFKKELWLHDIEQAQRLIDSNVARSDGVLPSRGPCQ